MRKSNVITMSIIAAMAALALAPAAQADSFTVFVGYADNLRASGFFPTPWLGGSGVVSNTPGGQSLDTGAVRIDNTGLTPITISNFQVVFNAGGKTCAAGVACGPGPALAWTSLTIAPGKTAIYTQTNSYNFDTSDFGLFGAFPPASLYPTVPGNNAIGGCSSPAAILNPSGLAALCNSYVPAITFQENGNAEIFNDTGHILDTGGWDFVNNGAFGEDGNESINWNVVGSGANRGGTVPEPGVLALFGAALAGLALMRRRRR